MGFDSAGTCTSIAENKLIEYSFGARTAPVEFSESGSGVGLRVKFDTEETHSIERQRGGWHAILDHLARHVGDGR